MHAWWPDAHAGPNCRPTTMSLVLQSTPLLRPASLRSVAPFSSRLTQKRQVSGRGRTHIVPPRAELEAVTSSPQVASSVQQAGDSLQNLSSLSPEIITALGVGALGTGGASLPEQYHVCTVRLAVALFQFVPVDQVWRLEPLSWEPADRKACAWQRPPLLAPHPAAVHSQRSQRMPSSSSGPPASWAVSS